MSFRKTLRKILPVSFRRPALGGAANGGATTGRGAVKIGFLPRRINELGKLRSINTLPTAIRYGLFHLAGVGALWLMCNECSRSNALDIAYRRRVSRRTVIAVFDIAVRLAAVYLSDMAIETTPQLQYPDKRACAPRCRLVLYIQFGHPQNYSPLTRNNLHSIVE